MITWWKDYSQTNHMKSRKLFWWRINRFSVLHLTCTPDTFNISSKQGTIKQNKHITGSDDQKRASLWNFREWKRKHLKNGGQFDRRDTLKTALTRHTEASVLSFSFWFHVSIEQLIKNLMGLLHLFQIIDLKRTHKWKLPHALLPRYTKGPFSKQWPKFHF